MMARENLQRDYRRERDRIRKQISRMVQRGYVFGKQMLPAIPKRITPGSIRRLQKITADYLYKAAYWVNQQTGEALPGLEARKQQRQAAAQKSAQTRANKRRIEQPPVITEPPVWYEGPVGEYSAIDTITEVLQEFPFSRYFRGYLIDTSGDRSMVLSIWDQMLNPTLPEGVSMTDYRAKLERQMESSSFKIKALITEITFDSKESTYLYHLRRLVDLLTPGIILDVQTLQEMGRGEWELDLEGTEEYE